MKLLVKNTDYGNKTLEVTESETCKETLVAKVCALYNISPNECRLSRLDPDFDEYTVIEDDGDVKEIKHKDRLELKICRPIEVLASSTPSARVIDSLTLPVPAPGSVVDLPFKDLTAVVQNSSSSIAASDIEDTGTDTEPSLDSSGLSVNER